MRLLGHRSDIGDLHAASDVFAFPSLYEGMPGAVLEAMALGVPVVGSDAPAIVEILGTDGEFGVVVPRGDVAALGQALDELLWDGERRARLGRAGRAASSTGTSSPRSSSGPATFTGRSLRRRDDDPIVAQGLSSDRRRLWMHRRMMRGQHKRSKVDGRDAWYQPADR